MKILVSTLLAILATDSFANPSLKWEPVDGHPSTYAYVRRAAVPGGWLIYTETSNYSSVTMTFVPDEHHYWQ